MNTPIIQPSFGARVHYRTLCYKLTMIMLSMVLPLFAACNSDETASPNTHLIPVEVKLSGMDISFLSDEQEVSSRATATEAGIDRIALKIFDADGKEIYSCQKKQTDTDFDRISCDLHVGTYTFVAIAHKARTSDSPVATITSPTAATLGESAIPSLVFAKAQTVTISGNDTQTVTLDMGKRITTSFRIKVTDTYPIDVEKIELILNPGKTAYATPFAFNPTTGLTSSAGTYTMVFGREITENNNFDGKTFTASTFLPSAEQKMDVTINMKSATDAILYTRTLKDITLKQHTTTLATGTFFTSTNSGTFTFDTTDDPIVNIPLNP